MTGSTFRKLREQLGISQGQLAPMLGVSKGFLKRREKLNTDLPENVVAGALAIAAAKRAGILPNLPQKKSTWRESIAFKSKPPFEDLPAKGSACGCNHARCGLKPVDDGEWFNRGHLWIFQGWVCNKRVYLNASGEKVERPVRGGGDGQIIEFCSRCRRRRVLAPKDSVLLGERIWTLRCRRQPFDPPDFQHDPLVYWWKRNGRFERLPQEAVDRLHDSNKRSFANPRCDLHVCARHGLKMPISCTSHLKVKDGGDCKIAVFRCRASKRQKGHAAYRVLPNGETPEYLGPARYRWTDATTGNVVETILRKRAVSKDRIMPDSTCPKCRSALRGRCGERKVMRIVKGRRSWKKPLRVWQADCGACGTRFSVRSDGLIRPTWSSRWKKKMGRPRESDSAKRPYDVGLAVERLIPPESKNNKRAIVEARQSVARNTHLQCGVVAEYHKRYRRSASSTDT